MDSRPGPSAQQGLTTTGEPDLITQSRYWWEGSFGQTFDAAALLLACTGPDDLEQATGDLLGRIWLRAQEEHQTGFHHLVWLEELVEAARPRAGEQAVRRLLYGIAAIAVPDIAEPAADLLQSTDTDDAGQTPNWLTEPPALTVSPDVLLLRDSYGLRFGLLTQVTGPGTQPRTYLIDIDVCHGFEHALAAGYYPDTDTAAAAWRDLVGVSATGSQPAPAPDHLFPGILPGNDPIGAFLGEPQNDNQRAELFRYGRISTEILAARHGTGHPIVPPPPVLPEQRIERVAQIADQFRAWAQDAGVDVPPAETADNDTGDNADDNTDNNIDDNAGAIVTALLHDWLMPYHIPELSLACSPHKIGAFAAYLLDDWQPQYRDRALALMPALARFCLDRTGVTGPAADRALAQAHLAADDPERAAGDLGAQVNRPIDETTLASPVLARGEDPPRSEG